MSSLRDSDLAFVDRRYGKNYVRLLYVRRDGRRHEVKELEVNTALTINDTQDYLAADNSKIVATDSQKNTVYVLAKKLGVRSIEEFATALSDHFLRKYDQMTAAYIRIVEKPWRRVEIGGQQHNHTFLEEPSVTRFCEVEQHKHGQPTIKAGLYGMKLMKTTQSAFVKFVRDEFRSLPDMDDRIFCTVVEGTWTYGATRGLDFNKAWETVRDTIQEVFAGPAETGVFSASVQQTLYLTQKAVLEKIPQVDDVELVLPNVHAYEFDFSKLPGVGIKSNNEVFMPTDKPSGNIRAKVQRKVKARL